MSATTPLPEIAAGLYEISPGSGGASPPAASRPASYFLTVAPASPSSPVTLEDTWAPAMPDPLEGWYIFVGVPVAPADAAAFAQTCREALPFPTAQSASRRGLVWLAAADPASARAPEACLMLGWSGGTGVTRRFSIRVNRPPFGYPFAWGPLTLLVRGSVAVDLDAGASCLTLRTSAASAGDVSLQVPDPPSQWYFLYEEDGGAWTLTLSLAGPAPGGLRTRLGIDFGTLQAGLTCAPRYFQEAGGALASLVYPFYPPCSPGALTPGFALSLHPLLPTDGEETRFGLDFGDGSPPNPYQTASSELRAGYFLTTTGGAITVKPAAGGGDGAAGGGFAFCTAPGAPGSPAAPALYLAPVGRHEVVGIDGPAGSPAGGAGGRWMCGLAGLEYIEIEIGDAVSLRSPMPALVRTGGRGGGALDGLYTTAWVEYPPAGALRRYFGQPSASVYFGTVPDGAFARPVDALLAVADAPACFPLVPYGGLGTLADLPPADLLAAVEAQALTAERHARLTAASPGPVFLPRQALGARASAEGGRTAETRQGFLVDLDGDGRWASLTFALSPDASASAASLGLDGLGSPPLVDRAIANKLLCDQLFLVVSDGPAFRRGFRREIALNGFTFLLDLAGPSGPGRVDGNSAILIFKYDDKTSLRDLVLGRGQWLDDADFIRDRQGTYDQILASLEAAGVDTAPGGGFAAASPPDRDPFAHFRAIAEDAAWTGVVALNCAIDGNGMPADLQMLLGGIDGQLRAHHLGIQGNTIAVTDGAAAIEKSSLFGLISYPSAVRPPPPPEAGADFAYALERLTVLFRNSSIASFDARVGLTVNALFGREVRRVSGPAAAASPPDNTLSIAGQYQNQDGIAVVTFSSDDVVAYAFPVPEGASRVLRRAAFDRASLTPVSAGDPGGGSPSPPVRRARFALSGALWFDAAPFPQAPDLDLFSYGRGPEMKDGLGIAGLAVDIAFTLDASGGVTKRTVTGDLSAIRPSARDAARPGSLIGDMPLQLSRLMAPAGGFTAASIGASPVHVLQLEPPLAQGSPGAGSPPSGVASTPNVTLTPAFGLEFDMPLGSLGVLSSVTVGLMAKLVVAWGPSRLVPETDAAAVLVQLPQVFAGYGSFQLQGILKTVFGDANLLMVEGDGGAPVYAVLFNNVQLSVLGKAFPVGRVVDFLIFAGRPAQDAPAAERNLAWFLGTAGPSASPASAP